MPQSESNLGSVVCERSRRVKIVAGIFANGLSCLWQWHRQLSNQVATRELAQTHHNQFRSSPVILHRRRRRTVLQSNDGIDSYDIFWCLQRPRRPVCRTTWLDVCLRLSTGEAVDKYVPTPMPTSTWVLDYTREEKGLSRIEGLLAIRLTRGPGSKRGPMAGCSRRILLSTSAINDDPKLCKDDREAKDLSLLLKARWSRRTVFGRGSRQRCVCQMQVRGL
jgi:hypothetical protein